MRKLATRIFELANFDSQIGTCNSHTTTRNSQNQLASYNSQLANFNSQLAISTCKLQLATRTRNYQLATRNSQLADYPNPTYTTYHIPSYKRSTCSLLLTFTNFSFQMAKITPTHVCISTGHFNPSTNQIPSCAGLFYKVVFSLTLIIPSTMPTLHMGLTQKMPTSNVNLTL